MQQTRFAAFRFERKKEMRQYTKLRCTAILAAALCLCCMMRPMAAFAAADEITVDTEDRQEVKGWGVYPNSVGPDWEKRAAAQDALYQDLGITQFRIELRGQAGDADGNIVDSVYQYFISNIRLGVEHGVSTYSVHLWSPPPGMKSNNDISGWNSDNTQAYLLSEKEDLLCQWVVRCLQGITKNGLPLPIAFSLQNEPEVIKEYQSCGYGAEQYIRVVKKLRAALDAAGYQEIRLLGPEAGCYGQTYRWTGDGASALKNDAEYAGALGIFGVHSYQYKSGNPDSDMTRFLKICEAFPEKERWQTEYCNGNDGSSSAAQKTVNAFQTLNADMVWGGVSVWSWWLGFDTRYSIDAANQEVLLGGDGITSVTKSAQYYALSRLYHAVPKGSHVRSVTTTDSSLKTTEGLKNDLSAYRTPEGNTCLVICNNQTAGKQYLLRGLSGKSATVSTVGAGIDGVQDRMNVPVDGGVIRQVEVPAKSVVIVATGGEETEDPGILQAVKDQPIDFYYRCINDNEPVVGTETANTYMAVGGAGKTLANHHYTPFKISLPKDLPKGTVVQQAKITLQEIDNRMPFALFYMPNEDWRVDSGKNAMYDDKKTIIAAFHRYSTQSYADIYPKYDKAQAAAGAYETESAAKEMLESAANGVYKNNYLGVYGTRSAYVGNLLTIDITAAVNRAIREGKSSVNLVMSAPGTKRTQFIGHVKTASNQHCAAWDMSWYEPGRVYTKTAVFYDQSGEEITHIPQSGDGFSASLPIRNTCDAEKTVTVVLAQYQGQLLTAAETEVQTVPAGETVLWQKNLPKGNRDRIRIYVFEDIGGLRPVPGESEAILTK